MASLAFGGNKICRSCLRSCENPYHIFDLNNNISGIELTQCLRDICDVQVSQDDNLPESICIPCYNNLKTSYTFRLQVQKNNSFLISILKEDLIEELPQSDTENIEIVETNECNEIKYPIEEYQISDINYITATGGNDEQVITLKKINTNKTDDHNIINTLNMNDKSSNQNVDKNNYNNEFVNYIDDLNKDIIIETKTFQCKFCDKKFKYSRNLQFHEKQHINDGYKQCEYCTKRFYKNYDLRRHIQVEHIKMKEYLCTICKRKFYTKPELNRHIKYHSNIKNFQCLQCEQKFYDKSTLDVHIRVVHLKEKNYTCELCNKKFSSNSKVRRHQSSQICSATAATKIISTINVGQHLVILDYDPNRYINNEEIDRPEEIIKPENLTTEESINSNIITEEIISYNLIPDQMQHITDPVQKFLN